MDAYIEDGMTFTYGSTSILASHTPGHTKGCMSFIITVYDEGRPHNLALWGGTGIMPDTDPDVYIASTEKFKALCKEKHVDSEVSNHPYVDNLIQKLEIVNHIVDGVESSQHIAYRLQALCRFGPPVPSGRAAVYLDALAAAFKQKTTDAS